MFNYKQLKNCQNRVAVINIQYASMGAYVYPAFMTVGCFICYFLFNMVYGILYTILYHIPYLYSTLFIKYIMFKSALQWKTY